MTAYQVEVTCPSCGGPMLHATAVVLGPDHASTEARCDECLTMWRFDLVATAIECWPVDRSPEGREGRARAAAAGSSVGDTGIIVLGGQR